LKTTRIAARVSTIAFGFLLFAYMAIFVSAHAKGYYFRLFGGSLQFTTASGKRYAMFDDGYFPAYGAGWTVYESAGSTGFFWKPLMDLEVGFSSDRHFGTDLVVSPDKTLLFVRRNTEATSPTPQSGPTCSISLPILRRWLFAGQTAA
jgi:hypothetical protein